VAKTLYYKRVEEVETFSRFPIPLVAGTLLRIPKACWSWGCVSGLDSDGRIICIADAHRKRFVVRGHEKLTAFLELEFAIRACGRIASTSWRGFVEIPRI
jgi:hypothetical protein